MSRMAHIDRISLLPDCIIHEILSFLSSKSVVQTCVLSKRWKTLWTDIPTLNFDFNSEESTTGNAPNPKEGSAKRFICRFLSEHRSNFIKKLSFSSSIHTEEAFLIVDLLLCYARYHSVQEICLNTLNTVFNAWPYGFPTCSSLTELKMKLTFVDWGYMDFQSLRIVEFVYEWDDWYAQADEDTGMFSDCPNLESLVLVNYLCGTVHVSAPKLEHFELSSCYSEWCLRCPQVKLHTPMLKRVKFSNILPTVKTASEFSCIHEVDIEVDYSNFGGDDPSEEKLEERFSQLLRVFHNARSFTLPLRAMEKVLLSVPSPLRGVPFHNLRHLKLKTYTIDQMTNLPISTLMKSIECPDLEKLEVVLY